MAIVSRGFRRRRADAPVTLPPGRHLVDGFPVLSTGPTPRVPVDGWTLEVTGAVDRERRLSRERLRALGAQTLTCDLHCVTTWSKLGTRWQRVSVDTVLDGVGARGAFVLVECEGGCTTNLRLIDVTGGRAWIAIAHGDAPLEPLHGGPARLLVLDLYLWKSAKWCADW